VPVSCGAPGVQFPEGFQAYSRSYTGPVVDWKPAGAVVLLGVPRLVLVVVQVVTPWEKEQPGGTADAGSPPVSALAVPAMPATRVADAAKRTAVLSRFNGTSGWCSGPVDGPAGKR
jgi:hypothetical protein